MTAELWHRAVPVLPSHELRTTAGFWGSLGFAIHLDGGYLRLVLGAVELHYVEQPDVDPFTTAWTAYVHVTNADLLHAEIYESDVMPDLDERGAGDREELEARWADQRDVSRLGVLYDAEHGMREFVLFDPTNNQITCGHPLGAG